MLRLIYALTIFSFLIAQKIEVKTNDGKTIILHPDRTWEYKDTFGEDKDVIILQNGSKYEGKYKSKNDKSVTFHVDGMPASQTLPLSMVLKVTLMNGKVIVDNNIDKNYSEKTTKENLRSRKTETDDLLISHNQLIDINVSKTLSTSKKYKRYETKNGSIISIGDTILIGKPFGDNTRYSASFGKEYKGFTYIAEGTPLGGVFLSDDGMPLLPQKFQDSQVIVKQMNLYYSKAFKKSKMLLRMIVFDPNEMISNRTIYDFDRALETGEVINPKAPLSKEQAIKKLKEFKELMDLELITKEEYDEHKKELTPLILGN